MKETLRHLGLIPGSRRFPGEGNGNPLQYSCLENHMDGGAWSRLLSMGSQRVRHDWETSLILTLNLSTKVNYISSVCWVTESCLTLCDPVHCNPPGSSVHGISQLKILEWVAISSSRGSSWPRDRTHVSCIGRRILYHWITWEIHWGKSSSSYLPCHTFNSSNRLIYIHAHTHTHETKLGYASRGCSLFRESGTKLLKEKKYMGIFKFLPNLLN